MRSPVVGPAALAASLLLSAAAPQAASDHRPLWGPTAPGPPAPPSAALSAAPMTFEAVMASQRTVGAARFSPDGRRVLVSVERHDRPTEGVPWKVTATETFVWDVSGGPGRRALGADRAFLPALCQPWSPAGHTVAGLVVRDGQRRLATWDPVTLRSRLFQAPPLTMCPTWAGERLVYPAPATGGFDQASAMPAAAQLLARWRAAWTGAAPQVTAHSTAPEFRGPAAEPGRLILADPETGAETVLASGDFHSPTASPDGTRLAVVRLGAANPEALSRQSGRIGELLIFALEPTEPRLVRHVPGLDVDYAGLAWSRDGARLLAGGRSLETGALALLETDRNGTPLRRIAPPQGVRLGAGRRGAFSVLRPIGWLGPDPAFIAATPGTAVPTAETRSDYGEGAGLRYDLFVAQAQGPRALTRFARQSVTGFTATTDGRALVVADGALWAVAADGARRRLSPGSLAVDRLAEAHPGHGLPPTFAVAQDRAAVRARSKGEPVVAVLDLRRGRVLWTRPAATVAALAPDLRTRLTRQDRGWAQTLRLDGPRPRDLLPLNAAWSGRPVGDVRPFAYMALGRRLTGWIVLPPGYRGEALPALMWIYGGDVQGAAAPAEARPGRAPTPLFSAQLWAARGYAVIYPSTPLGAGADTDVPATLAAQAEAALDAAASKGWVDPDRAGLIGHSFGGFSVAAVLSRSTRFRAGVAISGPYDFLAGWGARQPLESLVDTDGYGFVEETAGFVEHGQIALGVPPYAAPEAYLRNSPLYAAPRVSAPLLLMAGDLDQGATSLGQAERMYAALRRAGRPAALVRYWGQDHVQDDPWAVRDQWARASAWFDRYLAGARPPGFPATARQSGAAHPPATR